MLARLKRWLRWDEFGMRGAYARYVAHFRHHHPEAEPPTYEAFYLEEQQRRWSGGPRRCC